MEHKLKNFKLLTIKQKTAHIAKGSNNFWNYGILFTLIGSSIVKFISMIYEMVNANNKTSSNETTYSFNSNNYNTTTSYIRLSKYPSNTNITLGV